MGKRREEKTEEEGRENRQDSPFGIDRDIADGVVGGGGGG